MKNCNCSAVDRSHHVYCNLQATEISNLQLIIDVIYIWLIVFILISHVLSSFYDENILLFDKEVNERVKTL